MEAVLGAPTARRRLALSDRPRRPTGLGCGRCQVTRRRAASGSPGSSIRPRSGAPGGLSGSRPRPARGCAGPPERERSAWSRQRAGRILRSTRPAAPEAWLPGVTASPQVCQARLPTYETHRGKSAMPCTFLAVAVTGESPRSRPADDRARASRRWQAPAARSPHARTTGFMTQRASRARRLDRPDGRRTIEVVDRHQGNDPAAVVELVHGLEAGGARLSSRRTSRRSPRRGTATGRSPTS